MNKILFFLFYYIFICINFVYADSMFLQNKNIFNSIDNSLNQDTICISTYNNNDMTPTQFNEKLYSQNNYEYYRGGEKQKNGNYNQNKIKKHFYTFKIYVKIPIMETMLQNEEQTADSIPTFGPTITLKNPEKYNNVKFLTAQEIPNIYHAKLGEPFFMWKNYSAPVYYKFFDTKHKLLSGQDAEKIIDNINITVPYFYMTKINKRNDYINFLYEEISHVSYVKCYTKND